MTVWGVTTKISEIDSITTLQERRRAKRSSLVAIQPKGSRPPFFCVHAIAGTVDYGKLALELGPDQPFYGLQSQGLDRKQRPYETVEEMATHYVREVREVQPEGPYYLGGYSFGGKVAFEMARQLRSQGRTTAFLALFDTATFRSAPRPTRLESVRQRIRIHLKALRRRRAREKLSYLLRRAPTLLLLVGHALARGYEALFHPLRRTQREVLKANGRASRQYVPTFYEGRVTIFRARDRLKDRPEYRSLPPHLGWHGLCGEGVEVLEIPGGHISLMGEEENVRALGEKLAECLHRVQDSRSSEPRGRATESQQRIPAEEL